MACLLTTKDLIESAVIHAVTVATHKTDITSDTSLDDPPPDGLGLNDYGKQMLYFPIEKAIEAQGCRFEKLVPQQLPSASNVGDLVDLVCKDLKVQTKKKGS